MKRARWNGRFSSQTNEVVLDAKAAHHLIHVLRVHDGESCVLVDAEGCAEEVQIFRSQDCCKALRLRPLHRESEPPFAIHLIQALPRGEKADFVVQKAVELGATQIHFVETLRSQVRFKWEQYDHKYARWSRIASAAALQCGRQVIPPVTVERGIEAFRPLLAAESGTLCLAYEEEQTLQLKTYLRSLQVDRSTSLWCAVGPEGGWAEEEVQMWKEMGATSVLLGTRILRTETAGLAMLAAVTYEFCSD